MACWANQRRNLRWLICHGSRSSIFGRCTNGRYQITESLAAFSSQPTLHASHSFMYSPKSRYLQFTSCHNLSLCRPLIPIPQRPCNSKIKMNFNQRRSFMLGIQRSNHDPEILHSKKEESSDRGQNRNRGWMDKVTTIIMSALAAGKKHILKVFLGLGCVAVFAYSQVVTCVTAEKIDINLQDVKGADEAKRELAELVDFVKNPEQFSKSGAELPKGVLLVGPLGVGKTFLAKALAGEAGVPFFHVSGAEFKQMFYGFGAKMRIKRLFASAKKTGRCVIFIEDFDSFVGDRNDKSPQQLAARQRKMQLLAEIDKLKRNQGILVIAATNIVSSLDVELRRPGRFDLDVHVWLPDLRGRKELLNHFLGKIKISSSVDVDRLARGTSGWGQASLWQVVNQSVVRAVAQGRSEVGGHDLEYALDKKVMGFEKKRIPDEDCNLITAVHEAGHALLIHYTKDATPIHKATIMPRRYSYGHVSKIPDKEEFYTTLAKLKARMDVSMGGRAAEEMTFGPDRVTTGPTEDLRRATSVATFIVTRGLGESTLRGGLRVVEESSLKDKHHNEIDRLLQDSYNRARNILQQHQAELIALTLALLKEETLDRKQVEEVIKTAKDQMDKDNKEMEEVIKTAGEKLKLGPLANVRNVAMKKTMSKRLKAEMSET